MSHWQIPAADGDTDGLNTKRGILPGPYDRTAGLRRIQAALDRKEQRVERAKTVNRRRNKTARRSRRLQRKG
jgi:hypothetical protein